jgi:hypothetical protein
LNHFKILRRLACRNNDQRWRKARTRQRVESGFGKSSADVCVRDDGAASVELQTRTSTAEPIKQACANFDGVAAIAKLDGNSAHEQSIRLGLEI